MAYVVSQVGLSGGCGCGRSPCSCRRQLGETYVRDDDEDDDQAPPRPAGGSKASVPQTGQAGRNGQREGLARPGGMHGFGLVAMPFDVISGFAFDKSDIGPPQQVRILALARHILASAARNVRLVGHTDPVGVPAYNSGLGRQRAGAVRQALLATLDRLRPGSAATVTVDIDSAGETRPVDRGQGEPARARNRRVEVFLLSAPARSACTYDIRNAPAIERDAARRTLALSADVARRFIRTLGALGARGRFVPTVIDNKYWFAKLYEFITYYEIADAPNFREPAFVMHFIPRFYDLYYRALENWLAGNCSSVSPLWSAHFAGTDRPDSASVSSWASGVQRSIVTGVTAHIKGDMATALEQTYRSYVAKYCLEPPPRFDAFKTDFFATNRIVFDRAKAAFLLHLSQLGPFPVRPGNRTVPLCRR